MDFGELLYSVGERVEEMISRTVKAVKTFFFPKPSQHPPKSFLSRFVKKKLTPHEFFSLHVQVCFLIYLVANLCIELFFRDLLSVVLVLGTFVVYLAYMRYYFGRYDSYLITPEPYRFFYFGISCLAFVAFLGYSLMRVFVSSPYYYYAYVLLVAIGVFLFRWYFKHRYGRDYTYGVVEDVKKDLAKVFVHDDISANVKPGYYWVPSVPDVKPGCVVKLLVEERTLRSSTPVRILEVYINQSSHIETAPKEDTE